MAIYVFNLLVGFEPNGVDKAQGYRAKMLTHCSREVKHIFTNQPRREDILYYKKLGIDIERMMSMYSFMAGQTGLDTCVRVEDKLEKLKKVFYSVDVEYQDGEVHLLSEGRIFAIMLLDETNRECVKKILYFNEGKLIREETYMERMAYSDSFMTAKSESGLYAKLVRRTYYNPEGVVAYELIFEGEKEWYLFPNGRKCTKQQFVEEFITKLNLSENDCVILDRDAQFDFVPPLFQYGNKARIITVIHSEHYYEKIQDPVYGYLYLSSEYLYWFKYSRWINVMVVSTEEQKIELEKTFQKYNCVIPDIRVIPAGGIEYLHYSQSNRKKYSILTVSRIVEWKKIDWIIKSVVKAHKINPNISIDIYGMGIGNYAKMVMDMVKDECAESYIKFMGHKDVTKIYKNYEVFIAASVGETLGLSIMEAVGSGNAIIGLDVRYGNRLFIHSGKNGYLIDYNWNHMNDVKMENKVIDNMAEKIIEIFSDEQRLESFHQKSYEIAKGFSTELIKKQWEELLM